MIVKCIWEGKGARTVKIMLEKKKKVGRLSLLDFKTH